MIGKSKHSEKFILKGAMVFSLWFDVPHRSTRDIDLMGFGEINISHMEQVFRDICTVADPDSGLTFDLESVKGEDIKAQDEYKGIRIILKTFLGKIRIPLQVSVIDKHHALWSIVLKNATTVKVWAENMRIILQLAGTSENSSKKCSTLKYSYLFWCSWGLHMPVGPSLSLSLAMIMGMPISVPRACLKTFAPPTSIN